MKTKILALSATALLSFTSIAEAEKRGVYIGAGLGGLYGMSNSTGGIMAEGDIGYQFTPYNAYQISGAVGAHDNGWVLIESLFKLPIGQYVTPYFLLGAGYTHLNGNSIGADIGVGVNVNLNSNLSVLAQYKFIQAGGSGTPNAGVVSTGLTYYFGE
jgi:opacity protein-like surface antigen